MGASKNRPHKDGLIFCKICNKWLHTDLFTRDKRRERTYHTNCKSCGSIARQQYSKNDNKRLLTAYNNRRKIKLNIFAHYGNNKIECIKCKFKDDYALSVDHIDSGGTQHRREVKEKGSRFYNYLIKNNYPDGYRISCMNCQFIKRHENKECKTNNQNDSNILKRLLISRSTVYMRKMRRSALYHYSNSDMCCASCRVRDERVLSIDHISGGGREHIKQIGTTNLCAWLVRNSYPLGYQVLCMNCQWIKRMKNKEDYK